MTASVEEWKRRYETARLAHEEARAEIERLEAANEYSFNELTNTRAEIARLREALESLTHDPPASLAREPDTDCEVVLKMRAIARRALEPKP